MQPTRITITENQHYDRDGGESVNRSTYMSVGGHTLTSRNLLQLYRTYAKRSGNSRGSSKCAAKFTVDVAVPNADGSGTIVSPSLVEVSISTPIGAEATAISSCLLMADLLANANTDGKPMNKLIKQLDI